eukprot:gene439-1080_t
MLAHTSKSMLLSAAPTIFRNHSNNSGDNMYADYAWSPLNRSIVGISACLSIVGSLIIIASYFSWKDIRTTSRTILLFLSISDLLIAIGVMSGTLERYSSKEDNGGPYCIAQSFYTNTASITSFCWSTTLAIYLYLVISKNRLSLAKKLLPWQHVINWSIGPAINLVALRQNMLGTSADELTGGWCWIYYSGNPDDFSKEILWHLLDAKLIEVFVYVTILCLYISIKLKLHKELQMGSNDVMNADVLKAARSADRKLIFIPILLILGRMWGTLRFFLFWAHELPKETASGELPAIHKLLLTLNGIGDSSQGFLNCILFCFMNPKVSDHLRHFIIVKVCRCCSNDNNNNREQTNHVWRRAKIGDEDNVNSDSFFTADDPSTSLIDPRQPAAGLLTRRNLDYFIGKMLGEILQSSIFLSCNGAFHVASFCLLRKILGKFYMLSIGIIPGLMSSLSAILIERKSRRGLLALYMLNVASETVFRGLVSRGYIPTIPYGEVILFMIATSTVMYLHRKQQLPDGLLKKIVRLILGDKAPEGVGIPLSVEPQKDWFYQSMKLFSAGFALKTIPSLLFSMKNIFKKPRLFLRIIFSQDSIGFGAFLASMILLFRISEYIMYKIRGKKDEWNSFIAGGISGLSMLFQRSSSIALYILSKVGEVLYFKGASKGYLPYFKHGDALVYAVCTAIIFHTTTLEPHNLRPAYWQFMLRLTNNKFNEIDRKALDIFGLKSSTLKPFYEPPLIRKNFE